MPGLGFILSNVAEPFCELADGKYSVGRSRKNRIVIRHRSVSGEHCELLVAGSEIIVRERGSRNGVFVNGVRVRAQKGVRHGDIIRFGQIEARLDLSRPMNDEATAISAMDELRRYENEQSPCLQEGSASNESFVIEPAISTSAIVSNPTTEVAPPASIEETSHSYPANDQELRNPVNVTPGVRRWIYAGLGIFLFIAFGWILSKL